MGKRIKKVFTNKDQVLHLWANQVQNDARCSNVFFDGKSCYSYGYHYELGRLVEFNGFTVALINDSGYSNTTSKHIHAAYNAVSHLIRIKTDDFSDIKGAMIQWQDHLINYVFDYFKSRSKTWSDDFDDQWFVKNQLKEFNESCFKLGFNDLIIEIDEHFKELWMDHKLFIQHRIDLNNTPEMLALKEVKRKKAQEKALLKIKDKIEAWRNGGAPIGYDIRNKLAYHSIRVKGEEVQTTGGAAVPLTHALRLLRLVENKTAKPGEKIGHFTYNNIIDGVVIIGCHKILLEEAQAVLSPFKTNLTLVS